MQGSDVLSILGVCGLAWALSVFGIQHRLKKPFSCELCITFWICLFLMVLRFVNLDVFYHIKVFAPLFLLKINNQIIQLWQKK